MAYIHNPHNSQNEYDNYQTQQTQRISHMPTATPLDATGGTYLDASDDAGADSEADETQDQQAAILHFPGAAEVITEAWYRVQARQLIREFLRSVPRSEPDAVLAIIRADGSQHLMTRGQLTEAIDHVLRPRHRQIVRLAVEERWSRQRVCEYLQNISLKTFERDHMDALDALTQL